MDQRKQQLKSLKKEYKKEKRRIVTPWKVLAILSLFCTAILCVLGVYPLYAQKLVELYPAAAALAVTEQTLLIVRCGGLVALAVMLSALIMWCVSKRKLKRSEGYLNWRTMKEVLRTEKLMK